MVEKKQLLDLNLKSFPKFPKKTNNFEVTTCLDLITQVFQKFTTNPKSLKNSQNFLMFSRFPKSFLNSQERIQEFPTFSKKFQSFPTKFKRKQALD
jgi:hypothetical protein